jgi:hypothetical protein
MHNQPVYGNYAAIFQGKVHFQMVSRLKGVYNLICVINLASRAVCC